MRKKRKELEREGGRKEGERERKEGGRGGGGRQAGRKGRGREGGRKEERKPNVKCLYGCYVHSSIIPTFHRRCYWLLQSSFGHWARSGWAAVLKASGGTNAIRLTTRRAAHQPGSRVINLAINFLVDIKSLLK
ncbi:calmodulin-binding transcription activator 1 [Crotalus adamanteus]|uniref:Calmodulin-binding transcription activator 1 n=1 Tax=Crotalus adamanteus TaxID=8729 RepID=A0AAW1AQX7_CROAD